MRFSIALILAACFVIGILGSEVQCQGDGTSQDRVAKPEAKPENDTTDEVAVDSKSRRILFFTAPWCGACQKMKKSEFPELIETNWKIGVKPTDQIQIIDGDKHPELMKQYGIEFLPTLVLEVDGKIVDKRGYLNAYSIAEMFYGRLE